jgi:hypothetical protein
MGVAFPERATGARPQVSRTVSLAGFSLFWFWLLVVVEPVLEVEVEPVLAPVGFEEVGTTAGTDVQALSKTTRMVLDCVGTEAAATE